MRVSLVLVTGFISLVWSSAAIAALGSSAVPVKVFAQDLLAVTNSSAIVLDNSTTDPAAGDALGPASDSSAQLNYTHNSTLTKKITAQVTANPGGSDITLTVSVASGAGEKALVLGGATAAAQDVYTNIAAGALSNSAVTYKVSATAHGTVVSAPTNFVFTVTFTSVSS